MLSADLNYRYFRERAARYQSGDRWAKIVVAVASSAAVAGWTLWDQSGTGAVAWKVFSAIATLVAIALPIIDPANSMKLSGQLAGAWFSILKDYEVLWVDVDSLDADELRLRYSRVVSDEKRLVELESNLKPDRRLAEKCEQDVPRARGLVPA